MLGSLVVTLRQAEQANLGVLTEVEPDRADQVAHVLDEEQVHAVEVQLLESVAYLTRLQVTPLAGRDLHYPVAPARQPIAVTARGQIPDEDRGAVAGRRTVASAAQLSQGGLEEGRLAASGGADQVDRKYAAARQLRPNGGGDLVVGLEDPPAHWQADRPRLIGHPMSPPRRQLLRRGPTHRCLPGSAKCCHTRNPQTASGRPSFGRHWRTSWSR